MPRPADFRALPFELRNVSSSGQYLGSRIYWKIFLLENTLRVLINTILTAQLKTTDWFPQVADKKLKKRVKRFKADYAGHPKHNLPGNHDVYYLFLSDLTKILSFNSNQFRPVVKDIDQWIAKLEDVRIPRNLIAHMNWPNQSDELIIERTHTDLKKLLVDLISRGIILQIP